MVDTELSPWQRLVLAFWAFFAVLFRVQVAAGVHRVRESHRTGALAAAAERERLGAASTDGPAAEAAATPAQAGGAGPATATVTTPAARAAPAAAPVPPAPAPAPAPPPVEAAAPKPAPAARVEPPKPQPSPRAEPDTRAALQVLAVLQREGRLVDFIEEDLAGFPDAAIGAAARTVHAGCKKAIEELFRLEPVFREAEGAQVTVVDGFDPASVRLTGNVVGKPPFRGSLRHHGWRAREVRLPAIPDGDALSVVAPAEVEL